MYHWGLIKGSTISLERLKQRNKVDIVICTILNHAKYTVLHHATSCYTTCTLHCVTLYYTMLHATMCHIKSATLTYTMLHDGFCNVLHCYTLRYALLHCYSVLNRVTLCYIMLRWLEVHQLTCRLGQPWSDPSYLCTAPSLSVPQGQLSLHGTASYPGEEPRT